MPGRAGSKGNGPTTDEPGEATLVPEDQENYEEVFELAGTFDRDCQLYLLCEVVRLRGELRSRGLAMRRQGEELIEISEAGPWYHCMHRRE